MDLKNLSSNWKRLQASGTLKTDGRTDVGPVANGKRIEKSQRDVKLKRKRDNASTHNTEHLKNGLAAKRRKMSENTSSLQEASAKQETKDDNIEETADNMAGDRINEGLAKNVDVGKYIAIDCEMVGVGPRPHLESALARVSVVNYNGEQVYDSYVKPQEEVTDWRTHVSGISPEHMVYARSFEEVQADIAQLLRGRIVIGHSIRSDFEALFLDHAKRDIRDTARHPPYRKLAGGGSPKLKILASELLGLNIQTGEHSSIEDARATMLLFRRDKDTFEREHMKKWGPPVVAKKSNRDAVAVEEETAKKPKKKKKKKR